MTDEKQSGLIDKIKKLFAMAQKHVNNDGTSNEAEAAAAMAKAQELLTKYNLDAQMVQAVPSKAGVVNGEPVKREKTQMKRSAMYRWQQEFWKALAEANYCFHFIIEVYEQRYNRTIRAKRHVILGSQMNVLAVQTMGEYLTDTIERLVVENFPGAMFSRSAISWREGCAHRLTERIQEKMEAMKRGGVAGESSCTALAVRDLHETEYAANYDAQWGAGAYARMKQRHAEWDAQANARRAEQAAARARVLAGETKEQRERREKQEARQAAKDQAYAARYWEREFRKQQRREERRDLAAYARGYKKANDVNLDAQVKE